MTEAELQQQVLDLCKHMNLLVYHTYDSRRSNPGFPDLVIVGASGVLFRELKAQRGRLSPDQLHWVETLADACADVAVWKPSDWPARIHDELSDLGPLRARRPAPSQAEIRRKLSGT